MLEYAFAVCKISYVRTGYSIFHFPYRIEKRSAVGIKFLSKRFDMIIIPLHLKLSLSQSKIYFFRVTCYFFDVHLYFTLSSLQSSLREQSVLNVTSRKSTSVKLVTILLLKLIFLKILIIFFRILSLCCLFILQRINNTWSLYKLILSFESIFVKRDSI